MKKLVMCVWNDFDKDDRIRKKAYTLSKKFKVVVKSVCKVPKEQHVKIISQSLLVEYYWVTKVKKHSPRWFFYRLIANKEFWIDKIEPADIYDCNDPDTLVAGVIAKKRYGSKIMYDSHEYWKYTMRRESSLYYTIYSYVGNTLQYLHELLYIKYVDAITCVSKSIQYALIKKYHKPTHLIFNYSSFNPNNILPLSKRNNKIIFFGGKVRVGVDKYFNIIRSAGFEPLIIGVKVAHNIVESTGFLSKQEYRKLMSKCYAGFYAPDNTCKNIYYSMPNKIFEYVQAGLPIIVNTMKDMSEFVNNKKIGLVIDKKLSESDFTYIAYAYKELLDNLNKIKYKVSWEAQEQKLLKIYRKL